MRVMRSLSLSLIRDPIDPGNLHCLLPGKYVVRTRPDVFGPSRAGLRARCKTHRRWVLLEFGNQARRDRRCLHPIRAREGAREGGDGAGGRVGALDLHDDLLQRRLLGAAHLFQPLQAATVCGKAHDVGPEKPAASSSFASRACSRCSWSWISIARRWASSTLATAAASSGVSSPCPMAAITAACA